MATAYKVLGQSAPSSVFSAPNTNTTDLYTVPSLTSAVISTVSVTNTSAVAVSAYIWVRPSAATIATTNALLYNASIPANSVTAVTIGITLATTDKISVASGAANSLTFQAFGSEIS
jgi:hypothetical protein